MKKFVYKNSIDDLREQLAQFGVKKNAKKSTRQKKFKNSFYIKKY